MAILQKMKISCHAREVTPGWNVQPLSKWTAPRPPPASNFSGLFMQAEAGLGAVRLKRQARFVPRDITCRSVDSRSSSSGGVVTDVSPDLELQSPSGTSISVFGVQHLGHEPHIGEKPVGVPSNSKVQRIVSLECSPLAAAPFLGGPSVLMSWK
jgi:hypothetical protein